LRTPVDIKLLLELGKACEPILLEGFAGNRIAHSKSKGELVTDTDLAVSSLLQDSLLGHGYLVDEFLSEENNSRKSYSDSQLWIVDPLDGTKEFVAGRPEFALSICYLDKGIPRAGLILNPAAGLLMAGVENGAPFVQVEASLPAFDPSAILCSRSEWKHRLARINPPDFFPLGSIAYKLGLVAAGKCRGAVSYEPKSSWDVAAGVFLVKLGGGQVTDLSGANIEFSDPLRRIEGGIVASTRSADHESFLQYVQNFF